MYVERASHAGNERRSVQEINQAAGIVERQELFVATQMAKERNRRGTKNKQSIYRALSMC